MANDRAFDALCKEICEIAGVPLPPLEADRHGAVTLALNWQGIPVSLVHMPFAMLDSVCVLVEFGELPAASETECMKMLMHSNMQMLGFRGPTFSRHPRSGTVVLQHTFRFTAYPATYLFEKVSMMVQLAKEAREGLFFDDAGSSSPLPEWVSSGLMGIEDSNTAAFERLYRELCECLGAPPQELPPDEFARAVVLDVRGIEVKLMQFTAGASESVHVFVNLGTAGPDFEKGILEDMLDGNFAMATSAHAACYSRNPISGELFIQCVYALRDADANKLLALIDTLVAACAHVAQSLEQTRGTDTAGAADRI